MEESMIPSLSTGVVGSRFVSSDEIEVAKQRRDEQWKAAYARLGQEPPPQQQDDNYDGRSLAEKLAANKIAKQEEWEEKTKLANQFRALEEDEIMFLDSLREKQEEEERQRKEKDGEEVKEFKEAVAARISEINKPTPLVPATASASIQQSKPPPSAAVAKAAKRTLKGVVVKKKAKVAAPPKSAEQEPDSSQKQQEQEKPNPENDELPAKRRKIDR